METIKSLTIGGKVSTNTVGFTWLGDVVADGQLTDEVFLHCFIPERNFVYSQSVPLTRSSLLGSIDVPELGNISGNIYAYITLKNASNRFSTSEGQKVTVS